MSNPNSRNADPTRTRGNRSKKLAAVAAVGAVIALATIHPGDKPNTVKTSFVSYGDAKKDLAKLTADFGDTTGDTPKKAEAEINGSLEAALPLFKEHVTTSLSELSTEHNGGYFIIVKGDRYGFDFNSYTDDSKQRVDVLNMNVGVETTYLEVTYKTNGNADILYRHTTDANDDGFTIEGKTLNSYSTLSPSNLLNTDNYSDATVANFRHDFYGSSYAESNAGENLVLIDGQIEAIDKLLSIANQAVTVGHKEY